MKVIHYLLGVIAAIAFLIVLVISGLEIAIYGDYGWYEKEYEKYQVLTDLEMEMSDALEVTEEMLSYLRGDREDLVVHTTVDGREREFFNEREKTHMEDVQAFFVGGLRLRRGAALIFLFVVGLLVLTKGDWKKVLPRAFLISTGVLLAVTTGLSALISTDFDKYFTLFHEIFFDNDLWVLYPEQDLLIRMLPEGLFLDMAIRMGIRVFTGMILLLAVSVLMLKFGERKKQTARQEDSE